MFECNYGDKSAKGWLMADTGLVLKAVEIGPDGIKTLEWTYYQIDGLDDGLFDLPQGATIIDDVLNNFYNYQYYDVQ